MTFVASTRNFRHLLAVAALAALAACAERPLPAPSMPMPEPTALPAPPTSPVPEQPYFTQAGVASWYGGFHHGRRTASGERFDMRAMTAAHRTLPFGTMVRVTNTANGRTATVRINDRGPYRRGRVIDLSAAVAARLGMKQEGLAQVRVEAFAADQTPEVLAATERAPALPADPTK